MVMANNALLRLVRRLAIRDELLAMRLRGALIQPPVTSHHHSLPLHERAGGRASRPTGDAPPTPPGWPGQN